jgi:hypothetical protein
MTIAPFSASAPSPVGVFMPTLPGRYYTDPAIFELEQRNIFLRVVGAQVAVHEADGAVAAHESYERIDFVFQARDWQPELRRNRQKRRLAPRFGS